MMRNITSRIAELLLILTLLLLASCQKSAQPSQIIIISTNDMHSAIDAFPSLATLVESERTANPGKVLLIDAGDRWTGNPYVDIAPEPYRPMIELINELRYDMATFGNHEWDKGESVLAQRMAELKFDIVMANVDLSTLPIPTVEPYKFVEIDGLKIGILGLVNVEPNGYPVGKRESFGHTVFLDPWQTAAEYKWMRDSCDLYVGLTHIGFAEDSLLAVERPEFDLIVGGHSHTVLEEGQKVNKTLITQTGSKLRYAGVTTINYRGKEIVSIENRLVRLDTVAVSPRFEAMVRGYKDEPALQEKVGSVAAPMDKTALMNLFSDVMRSSTSSQFAFHNMGGMRIESLPEGDVKRLDIYMAEPFGNVPETFLMTMEEIKDLIINKFNSVGKESHTLDLYPSGLTYRIVTDGQGNATDLFFGHPYYPEVDKLYRVALSDYVGGAYDFAKRGQGTSAGVALTDFLESYFRKNSPVKADNQMRVTIE